MRLAGHEIRKTAAMVDAAAAVLNLLTLKRYSEPVAVPIRNMLRGGRPRKPLPYP